MMASLIAAAALAGAGADIGPRIGAAAAAEQALRGPLEGAWTLRNAKGHALFDLQIVETPDGCVGGAWRDLATGELGMIAAGSLRGRLANLQLGAERTWLVTRPGGRSGWSGRMTATGHSSRVSLTRD